MRVADSTYTDSISQGSNRKPLNLKPEICDADNGRTEKPNGMVR